MERRNRKRNEEQVKQWLTDERLERINHLRARAGVEPMSRREAEEWLPFFSEQDWKDLEERIG